MFSIKYKQPRLEDGSCGDNCQGLAHETAPLIHCPPRIKNKLRVRQLRADNMSFLRNVPHCLGVNTMYCWT